MNNNAICEHCESIFVSAETQRKSVTSIAIREGKIRQNMDYKQRTNISYPNAFYSAATKYKIRQKFSTLLPGFLSPSQLFPQR